jgi:hypothetical protein
MIEIAQHLYDSWFYSMFHDEQISLQIVNHGLPCFTVVIGEQSSLIHNKIVYWDLPCFTMVYHGEQSS